MGIFARNVLTTILPLTACSVALLGFQYQKARDSVDQVAYESSARIITGHVQRIEDLFSDRQRILAAMARTVVPLMARQGNDDAIIARLQESDSLSAGLFEHLHLADASGRAIGTSGKRFSVSDRPHFSAAMRGESVFSDLLVARATGRYAVVAAVPLGEPDEKAKGVLLGTIPIQNIVDEITRSERVVLLGAHGQALAISDDLAELGEAALEEIGGLMRQRKTSGSFEVSGPGGRERLHAFVSPVPGTAWQIAMLLPERELSAAVRSALKDSLVLSLSLIALMVLLAVWNTRRLLKPLTGLMRGIDSVAAGNLAARVDEGSSGELGRVIQAFNHLAETLAERHEELVAAGQRMASQQASLERAQAIAQLGSWEAVLEKNAGMRGMEWSRALFLLLDYDQTTTLPTLEAMLERFPELERRAFEQALDSLLEGCSGFAFDSRLSSFGSDTRLVRCEAQSYPAADGTIRLLGTIQDITAVREAESHIHYLAHHDLLTGLPNRALLRDQAEQAIASARRRGHGAAILFLDLDRFKNVNDTLGHPVGDRLLALVAQQISGCLRKEDSLARIGGDEFLLLISYLDSSLEATRVADKLLNALEAPFSVDTHELTLSGSIGIAVFPADGDDFDTLVRHADAAMFAAKEAGRNAWKLFSQEMDEHSLANLRLEEQLRHAVSQGQLCLHYQPQVDEEGRIIGAEALIRWQHPERGLMAPMDFIPLAEDTGQIYAIGHWALHEACRQQVLWRNCGMPQLTVAINISPLQFQRPGFVESVADVLARTGANPSRIELELTESALMDPTARVVAPLNALKSLGVKLALDDFGMGFSSLSCLKRFPLDRLKIDRSFVMDLPGDADNVAITGAILSMAANLGLSVVAEGVETPEQRRFLMECGCPVLQGFLFSRAVTTDVLDRLMAEQPFLNLVGLTR